MNPVTLKLWYKSNVAFFFFSFYEVGITFRFWSAICIPQKIWWEKKRKKKKTNVWGRIALNEVLQIAIEWKTFEKN